MNELMMMISLLWSSPVALNEVLTAPVTPAQTAPATVDAAVARAAKPAAPRPAARPRRHAILFFTASWCPSCIRMKSETLPYIALPGHELRIIDYDGNPALGQSYGIDSLPAYVILDGMGRAYRRGVGFRDVAQFVEFLNGR